METLYLNIGTYKYILLSKELQRSQNAPVSASGQRCVGLRQIVCYLIIFGLIGFGTICSCKFGTFDLPGSSCGL